MKRDYEVDPNILLKQHKYPKDELMMNPYLRYPLYHRLPLHYRLTMEEPIPVCILLMEKVIIYFVNFNIF